MFHEIIAVLPFSSVKCAPEFPASLLTGDFNNPCYGGVEGDGWQTISYTPCSVTCIVRCVTHGDDVAATLLSEAILAEDITGESL